MDLEPICGELDSQQIMIIIIIEKEKRKKCLFSAVTKKKEEVSDARLSFSVIKTWAASSGVYDGDRTWIISGEIETRGWIRGCVCVLCSPVFLFVVAQLLRRRLIKEQRWFPLNDQGEQTRSWVITEHWHIHFNHSSIPRLSHNRCRTQLCWITRVPLVQVLLIMWETLVFFMRQKKKK